MHQLVLPAFVCEVIRNTITCCVKFAFLPNCITAQFSSTSESVNVEEILQTVVQGALTFPDPSVS